MKSRTLLAAVLAAGIWLPATAGELLVLSGDEPLKTKINEQPGVNIVFLGSPT